ncbi:MAG: hypothetical protein ACX931_03370 [Saccharospirillum sp.]|jgi:hypothetical protein
MSRYKYVGKERYPKQDTELRGHSVVVMLEYDSRKPQRGEVLRADAEPPHEVVIRLEDGRIVLGSECTFKRAIEADG